MTNESSAIRDAGQLPLQAKINKMMSLANNLAVAGNIHDETAGNAAQTWSTQLSDLVTGYLNSGRDDVLSAAMSGLMTPMRTPSSGWYELNRYIRGYAAWERVDDLGTDKPEEYHLCCIPVFLGPEELKVDSARLSEVEGLLRQSGLAALDADVTLVPFGLVPAELMSSLRYSQVRQLTQLLVQCTRGGDWSLAREFLSARFDRIDRAIAPSDLYTMLVLYRTQTHAMPFAYGAALGTPGHDALADAYEALCDQWVLGASAHMASSLGVKTDHVYVGLPQSYFEGLGELDEELRKRQFMTQASTLLGGRKNLPSASALVRPLTGACQGFEVAFYRVDKPLGGIEFLAPPEEPLEDTRGHLREALDNMGIEELLG